jgi:hypothetical protein
MSIAVARSVPLSRSSPVQVRRLSDRGYTPERLSQVSCKNALSTKKRGGMQNDDDPLDVNAPLKGRRAQVRIELLLWQQPVDNRNISLMETGYSIRM